VLSVSAGSSAAHADTAPYPSVVGYDTEGNPIYSTAGPAIADPEEDPTGLSGVAPYNDVNEVTGPELSTGETCPPKNTVTIKNVPNDLKVDWADAVINNSTSKVKYTVKAETSKAFKWGLSASVSAEFKASIFAKVQVTLNGNIESTKTTTYGSTVEVEVPAKTTMKADRGMWREKFTYTYLKRYSNCAQVSGSGSGQAPYRQAWHIYN